MRDYLLKEYRGYTRAAIGNSWTVYAAIVEARESVLRTMSVSFVW